MKLTLFTYGMPDAEILTPVEVASADEVQSLVGIALPRERSFRTIDVGGANFRIGKQKLEAEREGDLLIFEEVVMTRQRRPS